MDEFKKNKIQDIWKTMMDNQEQQFVQPYQPSGQTEETDWSNIQLLPIAMKVAAQTIGGGGYRESDERIKKRKRILKLKRILDCDTFKDVVSQDEYEEILIEKKDVYVDGLVSVQPMSLPSGLITYMDFKYGDDETVIEEGSLGKWKRTKIEKERSNKIKIILNKINDTG